MITADSFPTPHLALRSADPTERERVRGFAWDQAAVAEAVRVHLATVWPRCSGRRDRINLLLRMHAELVRWRYELAQQAPRRLGVGLPLNAERFRMSIRDGGPNYDRLGYLGRLRADPTWNPVTQLYRGGEPTPASEIMLAYGQHARDRFAAELSSHDVLVNLVRVPGTRHRLAGNRLVRGVAARRIAVDLKARVAARGCDASRMEVGGDPIYAVTADPDNADLLFQAAVGLLADANTPDIEHDQRVRIWQHARYLLYQAPRTKKGSDAVTRVFLVAVGAVLFGVAPVLEQDVDLRCLVLGQDAATTMPADTAPHSAIAR